MSKENGPKLTLYDIARLAGTSKSTVSRVLMNQYGVSGETRLKIEKIMREHGYRPNVMARGLAGGRTGMIAVVTPGIFSGYYAEILKGVDVIAHREKVHVISSFAHGDEDYHELIEHFSRSGQVDGMVLVAPRMELFQRRPPKPTVPIVLVGAVAQRPSNGWDRFDSVVLDNEGAMVLVMNHLQEMGCRKFLHLTGAENVYDFIERRMAFERFCRQTPQVAGHILSGGVTRAEAKEALEKRLQTSAVEYDAVVACNDDMALGVLQVLQKQAIPVPGRVAVTGCDDEPAAEILGLTTLHMPMVELGEEAARLLLARTAPGDNSPAARRSIVEMSLVVRATSTRSV